MRPPSQGPTHAPPSLAPDLSDGSRRFQHLSHTKRCADDGAANARDSKTTDTADLTGAVMMGKNRIMIYGPNDNGTYVVKFGTGEALAISIPRTETTVIRHFQERTPYGLFVPDVP
jgi:hypothetical protein